MSEITIAHIEPPYPFEAYAHIVEPLSDEDGGSYLITFPDLPGCMSDGETPEEAVINGRDAFSAWMSARVHIGKPIPKPTRHGENAEPVRLMQRLPRSLHANLVESKESKEESKESKGQSLISSVSRGGQTALSFVRADFSAGSQAPLHCH